MAAVSIRTAPSDVPANPLQVAPASPTSAAAPAEEIIVSDTKPATALAHGKFAHLVIVSSFP
jgi:hypothetical protein